LQPERSRLKFPGPERRSGLLYPLTKLHQCQFISSSVSAQANKHAHRDFNAPSFCNRMQ